MIGAARAYAEVLASPRARWVTLGGLVGRFREAGTGLALVLTVRGAHASFALAGLASAAYLAGAAVSRPLHGRWVDRDGARRPLLISSSLNALALLAVALAAAAGGPAVLLIGLSALVGLSLPALSAVLRAMWPHLAPGAGEHAYAVDTLSYELTLILSPALIGLLAGLTRAWIALVVIAGLGAAGTAVVAALAVSVQAPVRAAAGAGPGAGSAGGSGSAETRSGTETRSGGKTRSGGTRTAVRALIAFALFIGATEGSMTVLAPGVASARGAHAASGLLLAALSAGSLVGALGYGPLSRRGSLPARLLGLTAALTVSLLLLGLAGTTLVGFAACAALSGLALSPAITAGFVAVRQASAPAALTEAFTWVSFAASAGAAGAQALCGVLIAGPGIGPALWLPALVAAAAGLVALGIWRSGVMTRRDRPAAATRAAG